MSVDNRIVRMKFDNAAFQRGVSTTISALDRLKQSLNFSGSTKGLSDLNAATGRFNLGPMEGAVTGISNKFLAMSTIAITALANIANRAVDTGLTLMRSLTIEPVMAGLREYETNLNSIQTILANTGLEGKKGLDQVNGALEELNHYSDQTIYNFSEMARNIGTFTAAGVDLDTSTAAIKGIANLAAVSGSNSQQASTAMYQLSQALAAGKVSLMDWNSVVNAGMGGKVFQEALKETARVHGVAVDDIIKEEGSFRDSISKGWITSDIMTETLGKFTGDLTAAQLKTMGYNEQQIAGILKMGKTATDAATKVKTMSQLIGTLQESAGSGWAKTWQLIFGDFGEAKELFTSVNNVLGAMIGQSADARNKILGDWNELGGRTVLIDAIANAFNALMAVLKPIKEAFRDIFPAMTGQRLYDLTVALRDFTEGLKISGETSENLRRTFAGVFAVFSIAGQVIKGVVGVIFDLLGALGEGRGGFLDFTGGLGDFLVALDSALKKGDVISGFFDGLSTVLRVPIDLLGALGTLISDLFGGFDSGGANGAADALGRVGANLSPLAAFGERVESVFESLSGAFSRAGEALQPLVDGIQEAVGALAGALADAFSGGNFDQTLDAINTGLLGGIVLLLKRFVSGGAFSIFGGSGSGGMFESITESFGALTGTLQAMQANVQANTLLKIAAAVGLLTISVVALSLIDSDKLQKALTAMAVSFGQLLVAMAILTKISGAAGFIKVPIIAASMVLLAGAVLVLTAAVKNLSSLSWEELAKGLVGVAGLLTAISIAVIPLSANAGGMIRAGAGILALAIAIKILASAVGDFAGMNWKDIGKGLVGVAGALVVISGAMRLMPKSMTLQAVSLVILGSALKIIASAIEDFAGIGWDGMVKGITGLAAALVTIAVAMHLMPKGMLLQATALVVLGGALKTIGSAVESMGGQTWEEIAKGLTTLAASLIILAAGLYVMSGTLGGAAALLVAAGALAVLAPVLVILGAMSWEGIAKGLVAIAGAFTVLGIAGLLLGPISPLILALSVALLALGAGLALAGAGALAFASAFGIVVAAGSAGVVVMTAMLSAIIKSIPAAMKAFAQGIVEFARVIAKGGPTFVKAFSAILTSMLRAVIRVTPLIGKAFMTLLSTALKIIVRAIPSIVNAGLKLILGFLNAISKNVPKIVNIAADIIVKFINGIANNIDRIVQAGVNLILRFISGVTRAIDNNSGAMGEAGARLAMAIVRGMASGIAGGLSVVTSAARNLAQSALDAAKNLLGVESPSKEFAKIGMYSSQGLADGLTAYSKVVDKSAAGVAETALDTIAVTMSRISDVMSGEVDMNPTISPVLDLTKLQQDATRIGTMFDAQALNASVSYGQAAFISSERQAALEAETEASVDNRPSEIKFEQNNYSPKALSPVEIYRQTRNQLSLAKEALNA